MRELILDEVIEVSGGIRQDIECEDGDCVTVSTNGNKCDESDG